MKVVIQRVNWANVEIAGKIKSKIDNGFVLFLGICVNDSIPDINWLVNKIINLRVFNDHDGKMNLSLIDTNGDILLISQFTLYASTKKGNRPSFIAAAKPEISIPMYNEFILAMNNKLNKEIKTGEFGADMKVSLQNDGPVTIMIDSKNKE